MMNKLILIGILMLAVNWCGAQETWVRKDQKYKGAFADGSDRTEYFFTIDSIVYPAEVCEGDKAEMKVVAEEVFAYRYAWKKAGSAAVLSDSAVFVIDSCTVAHRGSYYCELTDIKSGITKASAPFELKVKVTPEILIDGHTFPVDLCYGDTLTLDATPTEIRLEEGEVYYYFWSGDGLVGASNACVAKVSPSQATVYALTVMNGTCVASRAMTVQVNRPQLKLPESISSVQDGRLEIPVDVPATAVLSWKVDGVHQGDDNPLVIESLRQNALVEVEMEFEGCRTSDSCRVYVKRGMSFKGSPGDGFTYGGDSVYVQKMDYPELVCEGDDARLAVQYDGSFVYRFEWKKVGSDEVLADSIVMILRDVTVANRGKYFCRLIDQRTGIVKLTDTVELKIRKRPDARIGSPESPKLICYGDTITLNATASEETKEEGDTYTYSWTGNGIVGAANLAVVKVAPPVNTTYQVTVTNDGCSADTVIEVISYRPVVDVPDYVYISEGNTLELQVDVPEGAQLIWTAGGNKFEDINPFVYPGIRQSMEVRVKMMNEGCVAEDVCKVYVKRGQGYKGTMQDGFEHSCIPPEIVMQDRSVASCKDSEVEMKLTANGTHVQYTWQRYNDETKRYEPYQPPLLSNVQGLGTNRLYFSSLVMEDNGLYLCKLHNECGEVLSDTFALSVGGLPLLKSGLNKEWDQCGGSTDSIDLNVVVTDPLGGKLTYVWYRIDIDGRYNRLTGTSYNKPYVKLLFNNKEKHEGTYLVDIENYCGHLRDSVFIPVNTPVVIAELEGLAAGNELRACENGTVEFGIRTTGGGSVKYRLMRITRLISEHPLKYEAEFVGGGTGKDIYRYEMTGLLPANEGKYIWTVENACGKDTSDLINLRVETPPVIASQTRDTVICMGETLQLRCSAIAAFSDLEYRWYKNGQATGATGAVYTIRNANDSDAGNYVCRVGNTCPSVESKPIKVEVRKKPSVLVNPFIRGTYCEGDTLEISAGLSTDVKIDSVCWYLNNQPLQDREGRIQGSRSDHLYIDSVLLADGGLFHIQVHGVCGMDKSEPALLQVEQPARFVTGLNGYADLNLCDGDSQALTVEATGTQPIRYSWTHNALTVAEGFSNTIYLDNVKVDTSGLYCCQIQNRCGAQIVCAEIHVIRPDTFRFVLNAADNEICAGDTEGLTAILRGSDTATVYTLYRKPGEKVGEPVNGKDVRPVGGFIEFEGLTAGTYYVEGSLKGCSYPMPGEVTVMENPLPEVFRMFMEKQFCKDQHLAVVGINGSAKEVDIEYGLWKLEEKEWKPYLEKQKGNGDTIRWENVPEGIYKVTARNTVTGCSVDMEGLFEVKERELPQAFDLFAWNDDSVYCAGTTSSVVLQLTGKEEATQYTLYRDGSMYRPAAEVATWEQVEKGRYTVKAENQWGCTAEMADFRVKEQQPPAGAVLKGGAVFCSSQTGTSLLEIAGTTEGVRYKVYKTRPVSWYLDTMGTGGSIVLPVVLEDQGYYVVAEDSTAKHCRTLLADTAVFRMSRLKVEGNPSDYFIPSGLDVQLKTVITGAEGHTQIRWRPMDQLAVGQETVQNPLTAVLTERVDYVVTVSDASACQDSAVVSVVVTTDRLQCDIRLADKLTSKDTVFACVGSDIDLYAWIDGGTGSYVYRWSDESGMLPESLQQQQLRHYQRTASGWLKLEVTSGKITCRDSVWIETEAVPQLLKLQTEGIECIHQEDVVHLRLNGEEAGIRYILAYSSDGVRYNEKDTLVGGSSGSGVSFELTDAYYNEGYYRIRAEYDHPDLSCPLWMEGTARYHRKPAEYPVSGSKVYCEGLADRDTIVLAQSETGVDYTLYREPGEVLITQSGQDGQALYFVTDKGTGEYRIAGSNGVCADTMAGIVKIERGRVPQELRLPEKGSYCQGDCPGGITLTPAEAEVTYFLYRKVFGQTDVRLDSAKGSGTLVLPEHCEEGEYYILARSTAGCERVFEDKVKIAAPLRQVAVPAGGSYCDTENGYTGILKIENPQTAVDYKLYTAEGLYVALFDSTATDGCYLHAEGLQAGTYRVKAEAGDCSLEMDLPLVIEKRERPAGSDIALPNTLCMGDGMLDMRVETATGYAYALYRDSAGVVTPMARIPGIGGQVSLGSFGEWGTYYVVVEENEGGCEWRLEKEFRIDKALSVFHLTGDTVYCAADEGVVIGIDSTEREVDYVLYSWNEEMADYQEMDRLAGKGMAVAFKGRYPAATYRVKAMRGCEKWMEGELTVREKGMPADSTVLSLSGNGCADSSFTVYLSGPEPQVVYTLYFEGNKIGETTAGTGYSWPIASGVSGTYKVTADKEGCVSVLSRRIVIDERPFVSALQGDTLICANLSGDLYMQTWDPKAVYTLWNDRGEEVTTGQESDSRLWFAQVPPGQYHVVASRGNCEIKGEDYRIDSVAVPVLPEDCWTLADCAPKGEAWIKLSGMQDTLRYRIENSAGEVLLDYKGRQTDTLLQHLELDRYCLTALDENRNCPSADNYVTVREGVSADTLQGDFMYCEGDGGALLHLSGMEKNMRYAIYSEEGDLLEETTLEKGVFRRSYKAGKYVFLKERTGFMGGCVSTDTFNITSYAYPASDFRVKVKDTALLCAGQNYEVMLEGLSPDYRYLLIKDYGTIAQQYLDTLTAEGATGQFQVRISEKGYYQVLAETPEGLCGQLADTVLQIYPLPAKIHAAGCDYCVAPGEKDSCGITLSGLSGGIRYILEGTTRTDTLYGPGKVVTSAREAGYYRILGEDLHTGCRDTVGTAEISAFSQPVRYRMAPVCGESGEMALLDGADGDTVAYYLYKDGLLIAGPLSLGSGETGLSFGSYHDPGIYRIKAVSGQGCEVWMKDSAVVYSRPQPVALLQEGAYCQDALQGVTLKTNESTPGWNYRLAKLMWSSDTLPGDGYELIWDGLAGHRIISAGTYELHVFNACFDTVMAVAQVKENPLPRLFLLEGEDAAICQGEGVEINLQGSEDSVTYKLMFVEGGRETEVTRLSGDGTDLQFGKYSAVGQYVVYAVMDSSGCSRKMDERLFYPGATPEARTISGNDVCQGSGSDAGVQICVNGTLQTGVDYFLEYQAGMQTFWKDTLAADADVLCFQPQTEVGCYRVVARHATSGCKEILDGNYCVGLPPVKYKLLAATDTVSLCQGDTLCLGIDGSDIGIKYVLQRNGVDYGKAVVGSGEALTVGCVAESGMYKVRAYTADCEVMMEDSVVVTVKELPLLTVEKEKSYCALGEGVVLGVKAPAEEGSVYKLYSPAQILLDSVVSTSREAFDFNGQHRESGIYKVEVWNPQGCSTTGSIGVNIDSLPLPFRIGTLPGDYLCVDGEVELYVEGSEEGVEYYLYQKEAEGTHRQIARKYGTGNRLVLAALQQEGVYFVQARNMTTGCENAMFNVLLLQPADTVRVYRLEGVVTGYCYTDTEEKGSVRLVNSQEGVVYELYRNGVATGDKQWGNGAPLLWEHLEGEPCAGEPGTETPGIPYEVLGRDPLTGCEAWMSGKIGIVEEADPYVVAFHPNKNIARCEGQSVDFSLTATGCNLRYRWMRGMEVVKDTTESFLRIESVSAEDYGTYTCWVSNSCSMFARPGVTLTVRDTLEYQQRMEDRSICGDIGGSVTLTGYILNGTDHEWYRLEEPDRTLSIESFYKIQNVTPEHAGVYVYKSTNQCGTLTDTMELKIDSSPAVTVAAFRTDTLCVGSRYTLEVTGVDTLKWYRDGIYTGITGAVLTLDSLTLADEGFYKVRSVSACGFVEKEVARLYVDDSIRIQALRPSEMVCEASETDLYIRTIPSQRVKYVWKQGEEWLGEGSDVWHVGPLTSAVPQYTYTVQYSNKCTDKIAEIRLSVGNKLEYEDPVSEIVMCAQTGLDTFIFVKHPATLVASYQWYWQEFRESADPVKLEGEVYDTLHLSAATRNTGYYYCEIGQVCNPVTTNSCWFRIDTIPVLKSVLPQVDTVCSFTDYQLKLSALGGGLTYEWNFLLKDGTKELQYYENALLASTGYYETNRMETKYDSSRIWCRVFNGCGEVTSDTLLLRVKAAPKVRLVPSDTAVCRFSTPVLQVVLENGKAPWRYSYRYNGGALSSVSSASLCDTLVYAGGGRYVVEKVETDGCELSGTLAEAEVSVLDATRVRLLRESLSDTLCSGDTLMLRLEIEGGSGSWEIGLRKAGGDIAEDISADYPFTLGVRSRLLSVGVYDDTYYYVDSVRDLNSTSACLPVYGDTVRVWAEAPSEISLHYSGSSHVGSCRVLNLDSLLRPSPLGGAWYVNGVESDSLWSPRGPLDTVRYEMVSDRGCISYSDLVFVVDSQPSAEVIVPEVCCGSSSDTLRIAVSPAVQDYRVRLRQTRYRRGGGSRVDVRDVVVPVSSGCVYAEELKWSLLDGQDSCLLYDIVEIEDSHGCLVSSSSATLGSGQVYWHPSPLLSVLCRLPGAEGWSSGPHVYEIARGDSVEVRVKRMRGAGVWSLPSLGISSVVGDDTVFFLKDAGMHYVEGEDVVCGSLSVRDSIEIRYMQDGYLRGRLWLEGPYDGDNHMMHSLIGDKLGLPSASSLPALPSGSELIDWVVLEVRSGSDVDSVAQLVGDSRLLSVDSCLLLSDGRLADRHSGDTLVLLSDGYRDSSVYLVVRHRNHLDVMSSGRIVLGGHRDGSDAPMFDFTQEGNVYRRESDLRYHMSRIGGVWLLSAGELNRNQFITLYDPNEIAVENLTDGGVHAYDVQHDVNFDGRVDWPGWSVRGVDVNGSEADWNIVRRNRQKYSAVK